MPGPNNLLAPTANYLESQGSAKRAAIVRHLEAAWREARGRPISGQDWGSTAENAAWTHRVKRVLARLRDAGSAREAVDANGARIHGTWEWTAQRRGEATSEAEVNIGSGKHLVYGLYGVREKEAARVGGKDRWLMKVGKTRGRSPYARIQDGAFLPDKLSWGIAIWTDDPDANEKLIRNVLERRGHRYKGTGGTEWFLTNPDEFGEIYRRIGDGTV